MMSELNMTSAVGDVLGAFRFTCELVGVRGSLERDISSLRAFGPGGRQILGVVCVFACAFRCIFC